MQVQKFSIEDATFERSPGQDEDVFAGNLVDQRHGGPVTIGYSRWGPDQGLEEIIRVDDVMIVLEGQLTVLSAGRAMTAGPGEIVYMPKGEKVSIRADGEGAVTAYVTYPHWQDRNTFKWKVEGHSGSWCDASAANSALSQVD
jgi:ethanolamine utilization protein EutQ (cupin superfamily)